MLNPNTILYSQISPINSCLYFELFDHLPNNDILIRLIDNLNTETFHCGGKWGIYGCWARTVDDIYDILTHQHIIDILKMFLKN